MSELLRFLIARWHAARPGQLYDPRGMLQARPPRRWRRG